jgi:hypothetical protein
VALTDPQREYVENLYPRGPVGANLTPEQQLKGCALSAIRGMSLEGGELEPLPERPDVEALLEELRANPHGPTTAAIAREGRK